MPRLHLFHLWLSLFLLSALPAFAQSAPCAGFPAGATAHSCTCTGGESGSVWGSGPYTSDSNICVAARHAGVIGSAGGLVEAFAAPGQPAYPGSMANGVQTSNWGSYGSSFEFKRSSAGPAACAAYPGGAGPYVCTCTGTESGAVWGSGPYTADSNLCVAARHAGVIGAGGGTITVLGFSGLDRYSASAANGVQTSNWGSYGASVIFNRN